MSSQVKIEAKDGYHLMYLSGSFTGGDKQTEEVVELRNTFKELANEGVSRIIVDLGSVDYLASNSIGALVSGNAFMKKKGGKIVLCNASDYLKNIFNIIKLHHAVHIVDSYEDAIKALDQKYYGV